MSGLDQLVQLELVVSSVRPCVITQHAPLGDDADGEEERESERERDRKRCVLLVLSTAH